MAQSPRILAVDDDPEGLATLEDLLRSAGYQVITAANGADSLQAIRTGGPDIVLLDINMPEPDGLEVTREVKSDPELRFIPIVLLTARGELDEIITGFNAGADDYIKKPYRREELLARVQAALRTRRLYSELYNSQRINRELTAQLAERSKFSGIIGKSRVMNDVFSLIEKVSRSHLPVMIQGASGTGKELVARALHYNSARSAKPFVAQNCAAFNENLLESELFGHARGAFSGAVRDKPGLFEAADGGTLFLDEVGEMSLSLQAKLLRVIQEGTFLPVGSTVTKKVDVRIVAATHRDIKAMAAEGKFRDDLFYRLNVVNIKVPLLKDRREDIPLIAAHILEGIAKRDGTSAKRLNAEAEDVLCRHDWPGNIRELQNELERAVLLSGNGSELSAADLSIAGTEMRSSGDGKRLEGQLKDAIEELERSMIIAALERAGGNKSEAARALGISRSNLIAKAQSYGLARGEDRE